MNSHTTSDGGGMTPDQAQAPQRSAPRRDRLIARPYTLAFIAVSIAVAIQFQNREVSQWDLCFVPTAEHLAAGEDIYDQPHAYTYPPFQALLGVPVVRLPTWAQRFYWLVISLAAGAWVLRTAWRLAEGPRLQRQRVGPREHVACCLGLLAGAPFLLSCLAHQQTDLVIDALVIGGAFCFWKHRSILAGTGLGVAAAMKCTPLLFAPYFLWRRRWGAAMALIAAFLVANLLPELFLHPQSPHDLALIKWYSRFLAPLTESDYRPGVWYAAIDDNQSVQGAINRWTGTVFSLETGRMEARNGPELIRPTTMRLVVRVTAMVCGAFALLVMLMARRHTLDWTTRVPWECGMVVAGMLLFSPMSSMPHFGLLIVPGFLLGRAVLVRGRRSLAAFPGVMIFSGVASNKDLVGSFLYGLGKWCGIPMWSALAAFLGCAVYLATTSSSARSGAENSPLAGDDRPADST